MAGKLKALKPSMKENKRYLKLSGNYDKKNVEEAILRFIGVLGYAKAAPMWVNKNVIAVNREWLNEVRGAFLVYSASEKNAKINVVRVSGTLNGLGGK